jgi:serine/threonine-protein kinase
MDKNIGKKLDGRYEITELIGIGGMADVYKAVDIIEGKTVAVKILKNEFANDEDFLRRFRNESKAIAVLSHPNIVKIYDVGFTEKIQFIVMEYIDGITLKEFMEQQRVLKWKDAVHFIIQILRALQHAHDRGIVHRDIKPQNIMLFPDGTIKVMDFGIARFAREEGKTLSDKAIGSVHYISPEQARGDFTDEKSDIYSVGIMLYEMLTGQKPFDADNPVSVAVMHMQTRPKSPREINDTIPEGLEEIVLKAIQKDASMRYQSAAEMIKDIEQFKKNPSIVFEYKYLDSPDSTTKYFEPVSVKNSGRNYMKQEIKPRKYEYEIEEEYEEEEEEHGRMLVPILMGVAAAVVIVAIFFITVVFMTNLNSGSNGVMNMPKLVGMDYNEAKAKYLQDFELKIISQEYSDYDQGVIFEQSIPEGREIKKGNEVSVKVSKGKRMISIPSVANLEATAAENLLKSEGLEVEVIKKVSDVVAGYAIETSPAKGESVEKGTKVILYVSLGPEKQYVIVPNVVGKTQEEAYSLLTEKKLVVQYEQKDSFEPKGTVIAQSIEEKQSVEEGTTITLTISTGSVGRVWKIDIISGGKGSYTFTPYINGQVAGDSVTYDDIEYAPSQADIVVVSSGTQTIVVQIKDNTTGKTAKYAEMTVDFETGKYISRPAYNYDAFDEVSGNSNE